MEASERPVRVLVVEDDQEIALVLQRSLRMEGYDVKLTADGAQALDETQSFLPDLIVLDLGLPGIDGIEVARQLRRDEDDTPILILTARDALDSRVEGLDSGADDYLVKPFERDELLARMRALLRRRPPRGSASLVVGDLTLNPDSREVRRGDRPIELTAREFELLEYLMRNERLVVSRQALLDDVWGYHPFAETNTIDVFISNLRRKLEAGAVGALQGLRVRLPVRLKLAIVSAGLTFVILLLFAVVVGTVAERRVTGSFDNELRATAADLQQIAERQGGDASHALGVLRAAAAGGA